MFVGNLPEMVEFSKIRDTWAGSLKYEAYCHKCDWSLNDKLPAKCPAKFEDEVKKHNRKKGHSVYMHDPSVGRMHANGHEQVILENLREALDGEDHVEPTS